MIFFIGNYAVETFLHRIRRVPVPSKIYEFPKETTNQSWRNFPVHISHWLVNPASSLFWNCFAECVLRSDVNSKKKSIRVKLFEAMHAHTWNIYYDERTYYTRNQNQEKKINDENISSVISII